MMNAFIYILFLTKEMKLQISIWPAQCKDQTMITNLIKTLLVRVVDGAHKVRGHTWNINMENLSKNITNELTKIQVEGNIF